jgi:hypothetical protein
MITSNTSNSQAIEQTKSRIPVAPTLSCIEPFRTLIAGILLENWRAALAENPPQEAGCVRVVQVNGTAFRERALAIERNGLDTERDSSARISSLVYCRPLW